MRLLLAISLVTLVSYTATAQDRPAGAWLDAAPVQWNRPGATLPRLPHDAQRNITPEYCKAHERPVSSQEERAVAGAGWIIFASFHGGNGVTVVGGALSEDGMCRPDPYQHFVFVRGRFAGTLSPRLMRARSDGSLNKVDFTGPGKIVADFSRYTGADPLCCPSRISEATYEVRERSGRPVVILVGVRTRST
jgi:hypothetical protein